MCLCVLNKWRLYDESIEFLIMTYRSFCEIHLIVVFYLFGSYYGKARKSPKTCCMLHQQRLQVKRNRVCHKNATGAQSAPLQQRRKEIRLALFYKIANGSLPGLPAAEYLTPTRNKRLIKATKFDGCVSRNVVENHQTRHSRCFQTPRGTSEVFRNSFLPRTTCEWNSLEEAQVNCSTLDGFKISLQRRN